MRLRKVETDTTQGKKYTSLHLRMHVCIYALYVHMCTCIHLFRLPSHVHTHTHTHTHAHTHTHTHTHTNTYIHIHIHTHTSTNIHTHVYMYIKTHTQLLGSTAHRNCDTCRLYPHTWSYPVQSVQCTHMYKVYTRTHTHSDLTPANHVYLETTPKWESSHTNITFQPKSPVVFRNPHLCLTPRVELLQSSTSLI